MIASLAKRAREQNIVTQQHIDSFIQDGLVVIEDVIDEATVQQYRASLHKQLEKHGIIHEQLLENGIETDVGGVRRNSPCSKFFYAQWKLEAAMNERVVCAMAALLEATFQHHARLKEFQVDQLDPEMIDEHGRPLFWHPFGHFDSLLHWIDRVCYRLPDSIRAEGGLNVHMDRNPIDAYKHLEKWRPLQSFLALTDMYGGESGGLRATRDFHRVASGYDYRAPPTENEKGEFYRINPNNHPQVVKNCLPVDCPRGSLVVWDNRLPHATAQKLAGNDTRECIYIGYLPNIALNRQYVEKQRDHLIKNLEPPAYVSNPIETVDRDWEITRDGRTATFTQLQKQLLLLN